MSKLDDILLEPLQPVDYELLKRGNVAMSVEVTGKVKDDIKDLMLELALEEAEADLEVWEEKVV